MANMNGESSKEDLTLAMETVKLKAMLPVNEYQKAMENVYAQILELFEGNEAFAQDTYRTLVADYEDIIRKKVSEPWNLPPF